MTEHPDAVRQPSHPHRVRAETMSRPHTQFTGQWVDLSLDETAGKAAA